MCLYISNYDRGQQIKQSYSPSAFPCSPPDVARETSSAMAASDSKQPAAAAPAARAILPRLSTPPDTNVNVHTSTCEPAAANRINPFGAIPRGAAYSASRRELELGRCDLPVSFPLALSIQDPPFYLTAEACFCIVFHVAVEILASGRSHGMLTPF